ncbi:hypothetical protein AMAG_13450 [Allomyces macrogynus ATCC 38327]|uniref:SPIN90/Ldb17 leucine-rich domain-containing protein n=1 Tax=Allomyces macrogynus (strain ATCC 38327) TaxID=578462 RepID=A0A0L0T2C4_ALLM3|nr:hypothetical protein AMAG_13450 [Allomyces macrogynus ATCC 38327]|eukprot:KNE68810.1 hypothetical protein AMAG_13450 [Allomyces macrogynus ATCC 38327]
MNGPNWLRWGALALVVASASVAVVLKVFPQTAEERVQEILSTLENVQLTVRERLKLIEELQAFELSEHVARTVLRKCTDKATHPEVQSTLMAVLCTFSERDENKPALLAAGALDDLLTVLESDVALQATYLSSATCIYDLVHGNPAAKKRLIEAGVARVLHQRLASKNHSELTELLLTLAVRLLISYDANSRFICAGVLGDVVKIFQRTRKRSVKERCLNLIAIMTTFLTAEKMPSIPPVFEKYSIEREIIQIIHFNDAINTPWSILILKNLLLLDLVHVRHADHPDLVNDLLGLTRLNDDLRVIAGHILILLLHHDPAFVDALVASFPRVLDKITTDVRAVEGKMVFLEIVVFALDRHAPDLVALYGNDLANVALFCHQDAQLAPFASKIDAVLDQFPLPLTPRATPPPPLSPPVQPASRRNDEEERGRPRARYVRGAVPPPVVVDGRTRSRLGEEVYAGGEEGME